MKLRINENDINDTISLKDVIKNAKMAAKKDGYFQDIFIDKNGEYGFMRHYSGNLSDWNGEQLIGQVQTNLDNGVLSVSYVDDESLFRESKETPNIEVKHEGILEVPEGKNVDDLPLSHFEKLAKKKGLSKITKALNNLQVWNKNDDPKLSKWAGDMIDKLNKKLKKDESVSIRKGNNGIKESNNLYDYIEDEGFSSWGHRFGYKIHNEMTDDNTFVLSDNERTAKEYGEWLVDIYKNYDEETIEDRLNEFDYIVSRSKSDVIVTDPEYWKDERKTDKVYIVYEYDNSDVAYIVQIIGSWSNRF